MAYGKAVIAKCILEAESESTLFFDKNAKSLVPGRLPTIDMRKCASSWLAGLMRLLVRKTPYSDRARILDQCSFVVFNYDRCIEHFFLHALQRFYEISDAEASGLLAKARIYHPYGVPGQLDTLIGGGQPVAFGAKRADFHGIGNTALKTYTEKVDSEQIHKAMLEAEKIVFLGFAFHNPNMDILGRHQTMDVRPMVGTALGMSESDIQAIKQQIGDWAKEGFGSLMFNQIDLRSDLKAADIFSFYSKSL